jgi:thymidylate synthase (FAD)
VRAAVPSHPDDGVVMQIIEPSVELLWVTPEAAKMIELAARTCYKSEDKYDPSKTAAFLDRIINQNHHESVGEHASASFRIITDRGITHEIVRHRLASYSQESTRYVNYTKDKHGGGSIQFIHPLGLTPEQIAFSERAFAIEEALYNEAIALGMTPQQARDYLPNGVKTEIVWTANFREWALVRKLRKAKSAHPKMRVVADMIDFNLCGACPEFFGQYKPLEV